ncbi:UNVERIFIED_CONTAM: hypothetical protein K2H54_047783 [Gekko kuhli]
MPEWQASLDYSLLAFSHSGSYLASYSSVPEFSLTIWDWRKKILLCSQAQPGVDVTAMSFNPMSWHQLCLHSGTSVTLWNIERSDNEHLLKSKPVTLPAQDGSTMHEQNTFFFCPNTQDPYFGPVLPISAVAGLAGDEAETFKPKDDTQPTVHPTVHCWTPTSDLYMGSEEGYFLKIGADTFKAVAVHQKLSPDAKAKRRTTFRSMSHSAGKAEDGGRNEAQNVALFAMALHKDGLYAAGNVRAMKDLSLAIPDQNPGIDQKQDGVVRCYQVKGTQFQTEDCLEMDERITNLIFSPDYTYLLVETEKGSLYVFNPNDNEDVIQLLDASEGQFLGVDFIVPGSKHCVSVAESGEMHIWQTEDGACISKMSLHALATAMACSLSSHCVAVGTKGGHIFFIDVTDVKLPRVIHRVLLTEQPVEFLQQHRSVGESMGECQAMVLSHEIIDLTSLYDIEKEASEVIALLCPPDIKRARIEVFSLPSKIVLDNEECISERGLLKDHVIRRRFYDLEFPLCSVVKRKDTTVYGYASQAPFICKYHFASKISWKDSPVIKSEKRIPSKQFGQASLHLSPHGKWLASVAESGVLIIHDAATLDILAREHCHSYHEHGIRTLTFSLDGQFILVSGLDGAIVLLKWKRISERKLKDAVDFGNYLLSNLNDYIFQENTFLRNMPEWARILGPKLDSALFQSDSQVKFKKGSTVEIEEEEEYFLLTQEKSSEATWLAQKAEKAIKEETDKFTDKRKGVKHGIKKLRKKIQEMMFENAKAPTIEKLDQQEFNVDIEEQERQLIESEKEVARVRKDIEMENLTNAYLREIIKEDCWNAMSVKGRSVRSFHLPCEIQNYPMKERGPDEVAFLERILRMKKIEKTDMKDIIYNVKTAFNKEFDSVTRMKELEIARVKERNVRISEILNQLEIQEEIWEPTLTDNEKPDRDLRVLDSEIKVEKYLTPVMKAKEKIMARINYKRRLAAQGDNARERGLIDMMNGVLEIKKEDILKMILETELRKLQSSVQETTQTFDEIVNRLFEKKVKSEMVIYQEELKITNLLYSLLLDEELSTREAGLSHYLEKKRKEKMLTSDAVKASRAQVDTYREAYDILVAEDKLMERGFRKEFSDVPAHHVDQLFKLYKRRPRAQKTKVVCDTANPYGDRPGSVKVLQDAYTQLMKGIDEMDEFGNKPEGLDYTIWDRLCVSRRAKVESEQQIKQKALTLAEMQTFLQRRIEDDEKVRKEIEQIFTELNLLREMKMKFQLDLMVQFLFKQGQVELDSSNLIPDYTDAILINRSIIEELNSTIRAQGEKKVASMVESKDFRKGIFQLEWEHKKIKMQIDDLNQKARDIQKLNVTKDRQLFLTVLNYDSRMNHEVSVMEATLTFLDKVHKKNVQQREKLIMELGKQIDQKKVANHKLSKEIREMLVSVSERRHIFEASDSELLKEKINKEHYEDILQRQQLVDLAKAQAQELSILQAEVERLRMKTFPAFFDVQEY